MNKKAFIDLYMQKLSSKASKRLYKILKESPEQAVRLSKDFAKHIESYLSPKVIKGGVQTPRVVRPQGQAKPGYVEELGSSERNIDNAIDLRNASIADMRAKKKIDAFKDMLRGKQQKDPIKYTSKKVGDTLNALIDRNTKHIQTPVRQRVAGDAHPGTFGISPHSGKVDPNATKSLLGKVGPIKKPSEILLNKAQGLESAIEGHYIPGAEGKNLGDVVSASKPLENVWKGLTSYQSALYGMPGSSKNVFASALPEVSRHYLHNPYPYMMRLDPKKIMERQKMLWTPHHMYTDDVRRIGQGGSTSVAKAGDDFNFLDSDVHETISGGHYKPPTVSGRRSTREWDDHPFYETVIANPHADDIAGYYRYPLGDNRVGDYPRRLKDPTGTRNLLPSDVEKGLEQATAHVDIQKKLTDALKARASGKLLKDPNKLKAFTSRAAYSGSHASPETIQKVLSDKAKTYDSAKDKLRKAMLNRRKDIQAPALDKLKDEK